MQVAADMDVCHCRPTSKRTGPCPASKEDALLVDDGPAIWPPLHAGPLLPMCSPAACFSSLHAAILLPICLQHHVITDAFTAPAEGISCVARGLFGMCKTYLLGASSSVKRLNCFHSTNLLHSRRPLFPTSFGGKNQK